MKLQTATAASTHNTSAPAPPNFRAEADFRAAMMRAGAETANETPQDNGVNSNRPPQSGSASQGVPPNAPATAGAADGAGNLPPGGRRPSAAAAPDPDDMDRIVEMLDEVEDGRLLYWSNEKLNNYASIMRELLGQSAPRSLKEECREALTLLIGAGAIPRPPITAIAQVAAAPSLGMKAGLAMASLINWLPFEELQSVPQGQKDSLFAKLRVLRADPRLNEWGQDRNRSAINGACENLLNFGSALILNTPPTRQDQFDMLAATPAALADAVSAMTDRQLAVLPIWQGVHAALTGRDALPDHGEIPQTAEVQAARLLNIHTVPSKMQPRIDQALERFPHTNSTMRILAQGAPPPPGTEGGLAPLMRVTSGEMPPEIGSRLNRPGGTPTIDLVIAKMTLMDDYAVDQSAGGPSPLIRRPGEAEFDRLEQEGMFMAPPGTEIQIGHAGQADRAYFVLPPID